MKSERDWPPLIIGGAWVKRGVVLRRVGATEVWIGWVRLEDGRAASTSRSIAVWGRYRARELVLAWIRRERAGIRTRLGRNAPGRFPPIVHRAPSGLALLSLPRRAEITTRRLAR